MRYAIVGLFVVLGVFGAQYYTVMTDTNGVVKYPTNFSSGGTPTVVLSDTNTFVKFAITNGTNFYLISALANGTNGISGTNGLNGTNGLDGISGTNGLHGTNGISGTNGLHGTNGLPGINGTNGLHGTNGISGTNGLHGTNGLNGVDVWTGFSILAADVVWINNTVGTNLSGMSFSATENKTYFYRAIMRCTTTNTANGMQYQVTLPTSFTANSIVATLMPSSVGAAHGGTAAGTNWIASTTGPGPAVCITTIEGVLINGANAGTVQLRARSEVSGVGATNHVGSMLFWKQMN